MGINMRLDVYINIGGRRSMLRGCLATCLFVSQMSTRDDLGTVSRGPVKGHSGPRAAATEYRDA